MELSGPVITALTPSFQRHTFINLQLLKKNPLKRLGAGERDAAELKGEKFFEVNNFIQTLNKCLTSKLRVKA